MQAEKITQVNKSNAQFFYYSSSDVNCHSIQATIKQYANNIECSPDRRLFYYYSQFYMATFPISRLHGARTLMHIYHISVSSNRILISQLKIFQVLNLCFHLDSMFNLAFISHFYAVVIRIIQTFQLQDVPAMRSLLLLQYLEIL